MQTPHWGRDAQVLSPACGRLAHPGDTCPLCPVHTRLPKLGPQSCVSVCRPVSSFPASTLCQGRSASFVECVCVCVSSNPGCALGAVGYLGAGDVVMWFRCPEENIINHQYESGQRDAEEIDNRHRHFQPNLCWHVGVFGPQLSGVARPPLHVPVQLVGGRGDLSASRFHVGRLLKGTTLTSDVSPDSWLFIRVRTAEPAVPFPSATLFCSFSWRRMAPAPPMSCLF